MGSRRGSVPLAWPLALRASHWTRQVVRYGADYFNPGQEAKNQRLSAPNAPYGYGMKRSLSVAYGLSFR